MMFSERLDQSFQGPLAFGKHQVVLGRVTPIDDYFLVFPLLVKFERALDLFPCDLAMAVSPRVGLD